MPSTSKKQHNFMAAIANNPSFAKKVGVPQSVGKDFTAADKGKTFKRGGDMKDAKAMMARFEKSGKDVEKKGVKEGSKADMAMDKKQMMGMKKGGMPMKDGKPAFMKKMNMGGMAKYAKGGGIESSGKTKGTVIRMASGGSVSARADGIAQRGKTKFKMC